MIEVEACHYCLGKAKEEGDSEGYARAQEEGNT
jgi:hypothetical protein